MQNIIIRPIISEKSMSGVGNNTYTFVVAKMATKQSIKQAVQKLFNVHVLSIGTTIIKGKSIRTGAKRIEKKLQPMKKALIKIRAGEKIGLFESNK